MHATMKRYENNKPLISIHIPKCAGTSFTSVLSQWFGKKLYRHYFNEQNKTMPKRYNLKKGILRKINKKGLCIHGHFANNRKFGAQDYYPEVDQFITIIRNPFDIALSNYFYIKKQGQQRFRDGEKLIAQQQFHDLRDYLNQRNSYIMNFMPYQMNINNYKEILEKYFIYIGITEDLQTSVNILATKLGFTTQSISKKNISSHNEDYPESFRDEYKYNHPLEYAIYDYAANNYKNHSQSITQK